MTTAESSNAATFKFHEGQERIVFDGHGPRTVVVTAGQGGGKTTAGYWWILGRMRMWPGESHLIGFPNFPLMKRVIINQPDPDRMTLVDFLAAMGEAPQLFVGDRRIMCRSGQIFFGSGEALVGWEGAHVKSAWIDEFDEMPLEGYKRAMERTRLRHGSVLLTGTPREVRWVADELQPKWESNDPDVMRVQFPSIANPTYSIEAFEEARSLLPEWEFNRLYLGELSAMEGGNVFRREWWVRYDSLPTLSYIVQIWDTAFKDKTSADYSVCATWGTGPDGWYLLDVWRGKVDFPRLEQAAKELAEKYGPARVIIEDKASGQSLIQQLRYSTKLPIIAWPVLKGDDKLSRASAVSGLVHAGRCFLPKWAPWVHDFVEEHAQFPVGIYDDQVDTTSMALAHLSNLSVGKPQARAMSVGRR